MTIVRFLITLAVLFCGSGYLASLATDRLHFTGIDHRLVWLVCYCVLFYNAAFGLVPTQGDRGK